MDRFIERIRWALMDNNLLQLIVGSLLFISAALVVGMVGAGLELGKYYLRMVLFTLAGASLWGVMSYIGYFDLLSQ